MNYFLRIIVFAVSLAVCQGKNAWAADGSAGNAGIFDMILLGIVVFLLFRIFRRRSGRWFDRGENSQRDDGVAGKQPPSDRHEQARAMWDLLSDSEPQDAEQPELATTGGFDQAEFLEGAKMFYSRFQEARDSGDWGVVAAFIEPALLDELERESGAGEAARTEIMLLDAKVMDVQNRDGKTCVTVFFDALMRRGASGEQEVSERTAWEFSRPESDPDALWVLEGINKIDH